MIRYCDQLLLVRHLYLLGCLTGSESDYILLIVAYASPF